MYILDMALLSGVLTVACMWLPSHESLGSVQRSGEIGVSEATDYVGAGGKGLHIMGNRGQMQVMKAERRKKEARL